MKLLLLISPEELKSFQLKHYAERLSSAKDIKERMWLREQLYRLKKNV